MKVGACDKSPYSGQASKLNLKLNAAGMLPVQIGMEISFYQFHGHGNRSLKVQSGIRRALAVRQLEKMKYLTCWLSLQVHLYTL